MMSRRWFLQSSLIAFVFGCGSDLPEQMPRPLDYVRRQFPPHPRAFKVVVGEKQFQEDPEDLFLLTESGDHLLTEIFEEIILES